MPDLGIVHDDDDLVVVDKPAGGRAPSLGWNGPTVVGARRGRIPHLDVGRSRAPGRASSSTGTSGLMVVAKSERAYTELKRQFHDREVEKIYHTVVQGIPIRSPARSTRPSGGTRARVEVRVVADGKHAVTHYETIEAFPYASLLEVHLETGRTHQIRVHMAAQRHPCAGDAMYGADPALSARLGLERQWLHAKALAHAPGERGVDDLRIGVPGRPRARPRAARGD